MTEKSNEAGMARLNSQYKAVLMIHVVVFGVVSGFDPKQSRVSRTLIGS
jgi:hypothetical protein